MYVLFVNGEPVDQFNPIPDYWDENMTDEDIESWKGDASVVARYAGNIQSSAIANYLTRWDLEAEEPVKAYPDDEFDNEDWQLLDFMKKIGLPYPLYDDDMPSGQTYKFWTRELPIRKAPSPTAATPTPVTSALRTSASGTSVPAASAPGTSTPVTSTPVKNKKPWWKFW